MTCRLTAVYYNNLFMQSGSSCGLWTRNVLYWFTGFLYSMSSWPAVSIHWWFSQSELLHWYILNRYDIIIASLLYYSSSLIIGRNTVCVSCPAGYYCPYTDRDEVNACQLGSYSVGRQSSCTLCPAGRLDTIFPGIRYISLSINNSYNFNQKCFKI